MATESDVLAILLGIDTHPDEWRSRTLILADACRELGRDSVADLLTQFASPCSSVPLTGLWIRRLVVAACHHVSVTDRVWWADMTLRKDRRWCRKRLSTIGGAG